MVVSVASISPLVRVTSTPSPSPDMVIPKPDFVVEGSLMVAFATNQWGESSGLVLSAPEGWTFIRRVISGAGASTETQTATWWKIAGPAEPATYTFTFPQNQISAGTIMHLAGHDPVTPIGAHIGAFNGGTPLTMDIGPVSSTVDGSLFVIGVGSRNHVASASAVAGYAEHIDDFAGVIEFSLYSLLQEIAGSSGVKAITWTGNANDPTAQLLTINAAPTAPAGVTLAARLELLASLEAEGRVDIAPPALGWSGPPYSMGYSDSGQRVEMPEQRRIPGAISRRIPD